MTLPPPLCAAAPCKRARLATAAAQRRARGVDEGIVGEGAESTVEIELSYLCRAG